jgi:lysyl-tRNA synthetase class 2
MKRMLAAGATAIYQVTRAVRADELGPLHNPEFTMVEWYRVGDSMAAGIQRLDQLAQRTLCRGPAERLSYAAAFQQHVGLNPHRASLTELATAAHDHGLQLDPPWAPEDRDAWLDWLLVSRVQGQLGRQSPLILFDYPASQAALAQVRSTDDGPVAERFELYAGGIELANGYHELTDAEQLVQRTRSANEARRARGKRPLPEWNRLIEAMRHGLPPSTGVALGFDRLVLVALGLTELEQVMAFPLDRA